MEKYLQVGVITSTHGLKGEVKVFPTTDDPKRFKIIKQVILDTGKERKQLEITSVKYSGKFVILKFKEFNDINEVEKYRKMPLLVSRENAAPLKKNEYYIADLIGVQVETETGESLGELTEVLETGANDVYVVKDEAGKEILIPAIKQCIKNVDIENRNMTVALLEGLV